MYRFDKLRDRFYYENEMTIQELIKEHEIVMGYLVKNTSQVKWMGVNLSTKMKFIFFSEN